MRFPSESYPGSGKDSNTQTLKLASAKLANSHMGGAVGLAFLAVDNRSRSLESIQQEIVSFIRRATQEQEPFQLLAIENRCQVLFGKCVQ